MDRRNRPTPAPRNHLDCVEPLEERWLLSGLQVSADPASEPRSPVADLAPTSQASASAGASESTAGLNSPVQVIELGVATEDDIGEVEIVTSKLPIKIAAALDLRFPGAKLIDAERTMEDGTPVYEVNAEWEGQLVGVTLTTDGTIVEMEQTLTAGELPQPVLDWVRQNFPGAVIDEASLVTMIGAESYDLLIATPDQQEFQATLRVPGAATPSASFQLSEVIAERLDSGPPAANTPLGLSHSFTPSDIAGPEMPPEPETPAATESDSAAKQPAVPDEPAPDRAAPEHAESVRAFVEIDIGDTERGYSDPTATDASPPRVRAGQASHLVDAVRAFAETVASASPIAWLPQVAGVLSDVLPMDVAAVERGLQQLLDEIDSLAEDVVANTAVSSAALRLAVIASLITGAELVFLDSKKNNREPVLESNAANSSWSWVLGAATPRRP